MSEDLKDLLKASIVIGLIVVVMISVVVLISYFSLKAGCSEYANINPEMEFKFAFWNGCLVKLPDGMWMSAKYLRWVNGKIQIDQAQ